VVNLTFDAVSDMGFSVANESVVVKMSIMEKIKVRMVFLVE
jgi:hypothetical protein